MRRGLVACLLVLLLEPNFAQVNEAQKLANQSVDTNVGNEAQSDSCAEATTLQDMLKCHLTRTWWQNKFEQLSNSLSHMKSSLVEEHSLPSEVKAKTQTLTQTAPQRRVTAHLVSVGAAPGSPPVCTAGQYLDPNLVTCQDCSVNTTCGVFNDDSISLCTADTTHNTGNCAVCMRGWALSSGICTLCTGSVSFDGTTCVTDYGVGLTEWVLRAYASLHMTLGMLELVAKVCLSLERVKKSKEMKEEHSQLARAQTLTQGGQTAQNLGQTLGQTALNLGQTMQNLGQTLNLEEHPDNEMFDREFLMVMMLTMIVVLMSLTAIVTTTSAFFFTAVAVYFAAKVGYFVLFYNRWSAQFADPRDGALCEYMKQDGVFFNVISAAGVILIAVRVGGGDNHWIHNFDMVHLFINMLFIQLHTSFLLQFTTASKGGVHARVAIFMVATMLVHAVMFPMMIVYRVRSSSQDVALPQQQMTNLHFISQYFGLMTAGVTVAMQIVEEIEKSTVRNYAAHKEMKVQQLEAHKMVITTLCAADDGKELWERTLMMMTKANEIIEKLSQPEVCAFLGKLGPGQVNLLDQWAFQCPALLVNPIATNSPEFQKLVSEMQAAIAALSQHSQHQSQHSQHQSQHSQQQSQQSQQQSQHSIPDALPTALEFETVCQASKDTLRQLQEFIEPSGGLENVLPVQDEEYALLAMVAMAYYASIFSIIDMSNQMHAAQSDVLGNLGWMSIVLLVLGIVLLWVVHTDYFKRSTNVAAGKVLQRQLSLQPDPNQTKQPQQPQQSQRGSSRQPDPNKQPPLLTLQQSSSQLNGPNVQA